MEYWRTNCGTRKRSVLFRNYKHNDCNRKWGLIGVLSNCQGPIKDTKRTRERSSMQQADYHRHRPNPWMQERVSMHKSPTPLRQSRMNQARSEEEEKERKKDRKDRGQEADGKKGSPTKQKHIGGTKTRPTYLGTGWGEQRRGGGAPNFH